MKHKLTILFLLICGALHSQDLSNYLVLGQANRHQRTTKGLEVQDTLMLKGKIWVIPGAAKGRVLVSDSGGIVSLGDVPGTIDYINFHSKADTAYYFNGSPSEYNPNALDFRFASSTKLKQMIVGFQNQYMPQYFNDTTGAFAFPGSNSYVTLIYKKP